METPNSQKPGVQSGPVERASATELSQHGSGDVERIGDINSDNTGSPLSFADLGIPTGPKLQGSTSGKRRRLRDLKKKEIALFVIAGIGILVTLGFTVYKAVVLDPQSPDFIFAVIIIANAVFCAFYVVNGVLKERPYEIFIFVSVIVINVIYLIVNFTLSVRGTEKLIRLIAACAIGPVLVVLGLWIGREYLISGNLVFRTVGAQPSLQSMCRTMYMFEDLLKLDLQLGITIMILIMTEVNGTDIAILVVGIFITIVWFLLGHLMVRHESKPLVFVFWGLSPGEIAYVIFRVVKLLIKSLNQVQADQVWCSIVGLCKGTGTKTLMRSAEPASRHLQIEEAIAIVTFATGLLAVIVRLGVIVLSYLVFRNFGFGLKEKAYGTTK